MGLLWGTIEYLVLAGPHVGPDAIRRPIGNRPVQVFNPLGGAQRHANRTASCGGVALRPPAGERVANPLQDAILPHSSGESVNRTRFLTVAAL